MEQPKNCWWATRQLDNWLVKSQWKVGGGGRTRYVFEIPLSEATTHTEAIERMQAVVIAASLLGCAVEQVVGRVGLELETGWVE